LDEYVNPMYGVYAVKVKFDNKIYKGISNFGIAPTIRNNKKPVLEIHFFKKIKNIYNKTVKVDFISFVRKEKKFKSKKNLTDQIKKDINKAKKILENVR
jgi:riboflavin kinase/FMN adenylyltransferase